MKKLFSVFIFLILMFALSCNVLAHSAETGYRHSSNVTGWDIYETSAHWGSYLSTMTIDSGDFVGTSFQAWIEDAVDDWNSATFNGSDLMSMQVNNSSGCVVFLDKNADEMTAEFNKSAWAVTYRSQASIDSNNHYLSTAGNVEIWVNWSDVLVNKSSRAKAHVPLHEIGHVIGLIDVPSSVSPNAYLMCNGFGTAYAVPNAITTTDIKGAAVILGQHTSHTFVYEQYNTTSHRKYCSLCGIYNYYYHSDSSATDACTKCGYVF